jgi:uncharacterized protein YndB with AHSA1/START domain
MMNESRPESIYRSSLIVPDMPHVEATITIPRPPEQVFAFIADQNRRRLLLPDNFRDFRVLSDTSEGPGTRTSFTIVSPQGDRHEMRMEVRDWDPPRGLTEQDLDNPSAIRWSFRPEGDGTRVTVAADYEVQGNVFHRLIDRWFARKALHTSLLVELTRLQRFLTERA